MRKVETDMINMQQNREASPILARRQRSIANALMQSDTQLSTRKDAYSYSVLYKSLLPFSKY